MIDVLLVLLVIFMVVTPNKSKGLSAAVPQESKQPVTPSADSDVIITVLSDKTVMLNSEVLQLAELDARLRQLFAAAPNHVLFIRGARDLEYREVAQVIDVANGAGVNRIGLITR